MVASFEFTQPMAQLFDHRSTLLLIVSSLNSHSLQVLGLLAVLVVEFEHLALAEELVEEAADLARAEVLDGRGVLLLHPAVEVERVQEPSTEKLE